MKSNMWKSTFREIKQSFGRFMAIFAIIALGVSLFSGLKVLRPAMIETTDTYYKEKNFYNYRVISTLGFEQEDVEFLASQEDVRIAEGIVSFDVLCNVAETNGLVLKSYNLPDKINSLELISGRMPEKAEECIVDSAVFTEEFIGKKVVISSDNAEDDLEKFVYKEYTIVGTAQSPNYIQFERGNTSLGKGQVSGFLYLHKDAYDVDYFTEILVKFDEDYKIYSREYDSYMEEKKPVWEALSEEVSNARYERIIAEAEVELEDAKKELAEEKAKAETELEDARKKLDDGKSELLKSETELQDAKTEIADGKKALEDGKKELEDGKWDLWGAEKDLADGEAQLNAATQEINDNRDFVNSKLSEVADGKAQLEEGQAKLNEQQGQLDAGRSQLLEQQSQLNAQKSQLEGQKAEIATQKAEIQKQKDELLGAYGQLTPEQEAMFSQMIGQLDTAETEITGGISLLEEGLLQVNAGLQQLEAGQAEIDAAQKEINEQTKVLNAAEQELRTALKELDNAEKEISARRTEIEAGKKEIKKAWEVYSEGNAEILKNEQKLADGEAELADGQQKLNDGWDEYYEGLAEYEEGYREYVIEIADAEQKIADAEKEIADIERPESYLLGRETNVGYVCFDNDASIVDGIANVFPVFFYAVAALVCITTMNRMVEEQRTQIGVLKALGYSQAAIMGKYLFYSGAAAIAGCFFGYFFGTWFFPVVLWFAYGTMYDVAPIHYVFDGGILLFSLVVSAACSMGTTYLTCRKELSEVAAELMRPKAPKAGKRVALEKVPFIWNRMKFLHKVSYRNVFRYKKRFFMMVIGISGCTGLVLTGFGVDDSIANIANDQYGSVQVYDINVMLADDLTEETAELVQKVSEDQVTEYIYVMEKTMDLTTTDSVKSVHLVAIDETDDLSPYVNLENENGNILQYPEKGECILTNKLADTFNLKVGDQIVLMDENNQTMELTLSGIAQNYIYNYVYMTTQTYEECLGEKATVKSVFMNVKDDVDVHQLTADLMKIDDVASAEVLEDSKGRFSSMIESLDLLVIVIILCAAFLAFIVLYNLTNINITERIREIATIKVLGFHKGETASYIFRENLILTLIGSLVGLILGKLFHAFVMSQVQVDQICFNVRITPLSYIYSVMITYVFAIVVNWFMRGKLDKVSMTESLKSVD